MAIQSECMSPADFTARLSKHQWYLWNHSYAGNLWTAKHFQELWLFHSRSSFLDIPPKYIITTTIIITVTVMVDGRVTVKCLVVMQQCPTAFLYVAQQLIQSKNTTDLMTEPWMPSKGNFDFSSWRSQKFSQFFLWHQVAAFPPSDPSTVPLVGIPAFGVSNQAYQSPFTPPEVAQASAYKLPQQRNKSTTWPKVQWFSP